MAIRKVIPRSLDSAAASANLSFDANTLFVDSTNNVVGINTATPNSFANGLAVYNATNPSVAIVSGNANAYLRLSSTSDSDMYLSNVGGAMNFITAGTAKMYLSSAGNVGIGTITPASFLDVVGAPAGALSRFLNTTAPTLSNDTHAGEAVFLRSGGTAGTGNVQAVLAFGKADGSSLRSGSAIASIQTTADADQIGLGFYVSTGTGSSQTMSQAAIIDSSGNVGIGTTSPSTYGKFVVAGGDGNTQFNVGTNGVLRIAGYNSTFSGALLESVNTAQSAYLPITIDGSYAVVATGGTERMRIDSSGNVGIGTTSPSSKLDINTGGSTGTTDMITLSGLDNASAKQTYGVIRMGIENSTAGSEQGNLHLQTVESGTVRDRIFMKGGGEIAFSNGGTERMRIFGDGRVAVNSIATYDAATTMTVGGGSTNVRSTSAQLGIVRATISTQYEGINFNSGPSRACFIGRPPNSDDLIFAWDAGSALEEAMRFPVNGGIKFPATQNASANANTLDDYEEGTWTPSVGGTATYSQQAGTYTKIGRLVYITFVLQIATIGTGSTSTITGIPFACTAGPRNPIPLGYFAGTNGSLVFFTLYVGGGTSDMRCVATTGAATIIQDAYGALTTGTYIIGGGSYHAA